MGLCVGSARHSSFGESQRDALQPREMGLCPFQGTSVVHQAFLCLEVCEADMRRLCQSGVPKLRSLGIAVAEEQLCFLENLL